MNGFVQRTRLPTALSTDQMCAPFLIYMKYDVEAYVKPVSTIVFMSNKL